MAKTTLEFRESELKHLILEIQSSLQVVEKKSIDPFWEALEKSSLEGEFLLVINKKISGAHDQGKLVKVMGITANMFLVGVKFQCSPEFCYEATLSGKTGQGDERMTIPASKVNQELQRITGFGWYNPSAIATKKLTAFIPAPLVSVGAAVREAAVSRVQHSVIAPAAVESLQQQNTNGTSAGVSADRADAVVGDATPQAPKKETHGLSKDLVFARSVLEELARMAVNGKVTSVAISEVIMKLSGHGSDSSRKLCSPIMTAWVDRGWLKRLSDIGARPLQYSVTDKAVDELKLVVDRATAAAFPSSQQAVPTISVRPEHADLVQALGLVEQKARKFTEARTRVDDIELRKMEIEDGMKAFQTELAALQTELETLRPVIEDPDAQKAAGLLLSLSSFKPAAG